MERREAAKKQRRNTDTQTEVPYIQTQKQNKKLTTGPHKINGVPLRRVNQAYVIATSTKVVLPALALSTIDDSFFTASKTAKAGKTAQELFGEGSVKTKPSAEKLAKQKEVDAVVLKEVKKVQGLKAYLNASFALSKGQFPHAMKF
jgi:large subunit ribosomal protein L6e